MAARRNERQANDDSSTRRPKISYHQARASTGRRLEVRHTLGSAKVGLLITVMTALAFAKMRPDRVDLLNGNSLATHDAILTWIALALLFAVGFKFLYRSLTRAPALIVDDNGIVGNTYLGNLTMAWDDITHIRFERHNAYGMYLLIHNRLGSSGLCFWRRGVSLSLRGIDHPIEHILDEIKLYRPELV